MLKLTMRFTGLYGRVQRGEARQIANESAREAVRQATTEWITRHGDPSLSSRMKPSAFTTHGFKPRSPAYQKDQRRANGVVQPYASPRRFNWGRIAAIIAQGDKADPFQLLRALNAIARRNTTPMRLLVVRPGGYRVAITGGNVVRARITLPGARVLNKGGSRNEAYKRELLDMNKGAGRDRAWIWRRVQQLMFANFGNRRPGGTALRRLAGAA